MITIFKKKPKTSEKNLAVFIDGPNIIRKEFEVNLDKLREDIKKRGKIKVGKVFLNQYASNKLIEAVISQGFEPSFGLGEKDAESDVDVYMAVNVMDAIQNPHINTIVLVTRDADFLPVVQRAKKVGKEVIIYGTEPGFATALKNAADEAVVING